MPETKKANHQVNVIRVGEARPHTNADNLELLPIGGYQVVVRKGEFKTGDLAIYIQPDSVVPKTEPFRFIWEGYECEPDGDVPVRRRRITVRKFRKEWSEGLLMPIRTFAVDVVTQDGKMTSAGISDGSTVQDVEEGDDVSELLNITHYEVEEKGTGGYEYAPKKKCRMPRTFKGWLHYILHFGWLWSAKRRLKGENTETGVNAPRYDVEALKNHMDAFVPGESVDVTEKIHGSNSRYMFLEDHMYAGSHNLWKAPNSKCVRRQVLEVQPWIEAWCKAHEGYALYGELTPTQKGFNYGSDELQFFAFDIYTPEGKWIKPWDFVEIPSESVNAPNYQGIVQMVPFLGCVPFDLDTIKKMYVDGNTETGGNHVREGVVVSAVDPEREAHGVGRLQLKIVSNAYYERDQKNESLV